MADFPAASRTLIDNNELAELLPHKGKMLLLSRITEYDINSRTLCSEYDISEDCLFYDPSFDGVPVWMSFEFMAQAISALSGLTGRYFGMPPMIGFILSVSSFEIKTPILRPGEVAQVSIGEKMRVGMVSTFQCSVFSNKIEVSRANLMLMDVDNPREFMERDSYGK